MSGWSHAHEKLAGLAGAIAHRCGEIAGMVTMTALADALWKQQGRKALAPVISSAQGIHTRIAGIAAQNTLLDVGTKLLAEEWRSLREVLATSFRDTGLPPDKRQQNLAETRALSRGIHDVVSRVSGSLTASAIRQAYPPEDDPASTVSPEENQHAP